MGALFSSAKIYIVADGVSSKRALQLARGDFFGFHPKKRLGLSSALPRPTLNFGACGAMCPPCPPAALAKAAAHAP
jgi:hypothetical protein